MIHNSLDSEDELHGLLWRFPTLIFLASENRFFELRFDPHKKQFRHVIHVVFNPHKKAIFPARSHWSHCIFPLHYFIQQEVFDTHDRQLPPLHAFTPSCKSMSRHFRHHLRVVFPIAGRHTTGSFKPQGLSRGYESSLIAIVSRSSGSRMISVYQLKAYP